MFYPIDNIPEDELAKNFFLLKNFLEKTPVVIEELAVKFEENAYDVTDELPYYVNVKEVIISTFEQLQSAQLDFKLEITLNPKELTERLSANGLTKDSLIAKLQMLDWLWQTAKDKIYDLRNNLNDSLFTALIRQLKSILKSLLESLGFSDDIYDEALELLNSFKELGKY